MIPRVLAVHTIYKHWEMRSLRSQHSRSDVVLSRSLMERDHACAVRSKTIMNIIAQSPQRGLTRNDLPQNQ
jgi:hypothetical protein